MNKSTPLDLYILCNEAEMKDQTLKRFFFVEIVMKYDMYLQLKQSTLIAIQIKRKVLFLSKHFNVRLLFMLNISTVLFSIP